MLLIVFGFTVLLTAAPADADNSAGLAEAEGGPETDAVLLAIGLLPVACLCYVKTSF